MKRFLITAAGTFAGIVAAMVACTAYFANSSRHAVCNPRYISPENQLRSMEAIGMEIDKGVELSVSQYMRVGRSQDALTLVYGEMDRLCK
jgi:hypothetical protein